MKFQSGLIVGIALLLSGCSTLSNVNWSAAAPWNWFGGTPEITDEGVGDLTASTPLEQSAVQDALGSDYRVRGGMKTENGDVVRYIEALRDDKLAMVVDGNAGTVSRIDVRDEAITTSKGISIGTPFPTLFDKAYGNCQSTRIDSESLGAVSCKAPDNPHISYVFIGDWKGPDGLMPPNDVLKHWNVQRIIWQR